MKNIAGYCFWNSYSDEIMNYRNFKDFIHLLEICCCPYSKLPLTLVTLPELQKILSSQELEKIHSDTTGAMICSGSGNAYPIIGDIVSFKEEHTLRLLNEANVENWPTEDSNSTSISKSVQQWYDKFGWKKNNSGIYNDSAVYSGNAQRANQYYELDSHLSLHQWLMNGKFLLDAASGAIAHPEYLTYSWYYKWRVCVDLSITALQEAAAKLGNRGFCCLIDISHLPFNDNSFDGIVSGYTIQHIPAINQRQAVSELYRVLAPGKHCSIMTHLQLGTAGRRFRRILELTGNSVRPKVPQNLEQETSSDQQPTLYGCNQTLDWWKQIAIELKANFEIRSLRIFNKTEFEQLIGDSFKKTTRLRLLETALPKLMARISRYGLVVLTKPD